MSPRRRLPARVYWIRRGVLFAVVAAVVGGAVAALGMFGGGSHPMRAMTTARQHPIVTPTPSPTASASTGKRHGKHGKVLLAQPSGTCNAADLVATPAIGKVDGGGNVRLRIELTGLAPACAWHVSPQSLVVKITSGVDRVWSTQDCPADVPTQDVVVRHAVPTKVFLTWNGKRSEAGCPRGTAWADPGYYHAVAAALGGPPTDVQFLVGLPPRPVVTKTTHPNPHLNMPTPRDVVPSTSPTPH